MEDLLLITYNDRYGNGDDKSVEGVTNNFNLWLKEHNENRIANGDEPESQEEFDLTIIAPKIY